MGWWLEGTESIMVQKAGFIATEYATEIPHISVEQGAETGQDVRKAGWGVGG